MTKHSKAATALRAQQVLPLAGHDWGRVWVGLAIWARRARWVVIEDGQPRGTYRDGAEARLAAMRLARADCE